MDISDGTELLSRAYLPLDETNKGTKRRDLFFIVGGLVFTPVQANAVHDLILGIRQRYKYAERDIAVCCR